MCVWVTEPFTCACHFHLCVCGQQRRNITYACCAGQQAALYARPNAGMTLPPQGSANITWP